MRLILVSKVLTCNRGHITLYPLFIKGQSFSSPSLVPPKRATIVDHPPNNNSEYMMCAMYSSHESSVCDFVLLQRLC